MLVPVGLFFFTRPVALSGKDWNISVCVFSKVMASVQFTDVSLSWKEQPASSALGRYYSLECMSCSSEDSSRPFQSFSRTHITNNEVVLRNLQPETNYKLVLKVYSDIVVPNQLRVPSVAVQFTTSFKRKTRLFILCRHFDPTLLNKSTQLLQGFCF